MGINTGAQREREGHQCVYRQVHTQIDRNSSVGIDTGVQIYRDTSVCIDRCTHK